MGTAGTAGTVGTHSDGITEGGPAIQFPFLCEEKCFSTVKRLLKISKTDSSLNP